MRGETSREKYLNEVFGVSDPVLARVRESMDADGFASMALGPHEARLLQVLLTVAGVRTVVEIGTLYGYSALAMAAVLGPDGKLVTIEADRARFELARATFARSDRAGLIDARHGAALEVLATLEGPFDAVFIDANKREYPLYLDWAEANVRKGGLVIGDNTFLWGAVYDEPSRESTGLKQTEAMKDFNRRLNDPDRYASTLIPTLEGMTVAQKLF